MRCPKCDSPIGKNTYTCRYCGARITRPPTKINRSMGSNARTCLISGALLILIGGTMMLYDAWLFGIVMFSAGAILLGIGKLMSK